MRTGAWDGAYCAPCGRVERGDALMPSLQTGYQRVIYESRGSWGGLLFPIWHKGDQDSRENRRERYALVRSFFPPLSGWVNFWCRPGTCLNRSDRGDSFCRAYGAGWVGDSRLPARGRVILTKNGVAVKAGWAIRVRFGLGRRLKPTLLKERCRD